jgi:hypothetical protein
MQGMRDESIWKNLALAFGDGLAFGVGVKLSQDAAARLTPARADVRTLAERLSEIEQRIEKARQNHTLPGQFNQKMVEAVVAVVDAKLREQADRFEQRLGEELASLRAEFIEQIAIARKRSEEGNHVLRAQMTALHRQFAESLGRLVDEQIAATIDVRLAPLETELRQEIREQAERVAGIAAAAADEHVVTRMHPMQDAVSDLSRRLEDNDRNTLELVLQLGHLCLHTAERLSVPIEPAAPPAVEERHPDAAPEAAAAIAGAESPAALETAPAPADAAKPLWASHWYRPSSWPRAACYCCIIYRVARAEGRAILKPREDYQRPRIPAIVPVSRAALPPVPWWKAHHPEARCDADSHRNR